MSTKVLFKTMFPITVLAVIILAAQVGNSQSALDPAPEVPMEDRSIAGPDYYERHIAELEANYYAGSDFIERNPSNYYTGSDYYERNALAFSAMAAPDLAGSDWIERHPTVVTAVAAPSLAGSDWIERHPTVVIAANYYAGSDFIERRPSSYYTGSDYIERHP